MPDAPPRRQRRSSHRANDLGGAEWTRCSISVWNDVRKTAEETALRHPAMFPTALVARVIGCFTRAEQRHVLDPFCGSGSTLLAAHACEGRGIGFEVSAEYVRLARERLERAGARGYTLHHESAARIPERLAPQSVDLCVTSPPYWDILARKRSADGRDVRDYPPADGDLSRLGDYSEFVEAVGRIFDGVCTVLRPGAYCVVNVMDLRRGARFYPFHSDLAARLTDAGRGGCLELDDIIVWDRRGDYNRLRPLGFPAVFRVNKVHEFLLIFRRPR
jgi:hypothetical protein